MVVDSVSSMTAGPPVRQPGGSASLAYFRLHGSPRTYYSDYDEERLDAWEERVRAAAESAQHVWCVFDNTALGFAVPNAVEMIRRIAAGDAAT